MAELVMLVTQGGVPVQLVDQTGTVFPTTGTGSLVFSNGPTLTNPVVGTQTPGNNTTLAASTAFVTAAIAAVTAAEITVGTSVILNGTTTRILYNNAGVLGEYTISGSGTVVVMQTGASLITPALGIATATSINKVVITAPATSATLTIPDGVTLNAGAGGTLGAAAFLTPGAGVATWLTTPSSSNLATAVTDETGSGALVFGTSPTITTDLTVNTGAQSNFKIARGSVATTYNMLSFNSVLTVAGMVGLQGGATGDGNLYYNIPSSFTHVLQVNAVPVVYINSSGIDAILDRGLRFDNQTSSAAAQLGTLTNAPAAGNPGYWLKIAIGGVSYALPCWAG